MIASGVLTFLFALLVIYNLLGGGDDSNMAGPTPSGADLQAAAAAMAQYDGTSAAPMQDYVDALTKVAPKCSEHIGQVAGIFENAAAQAVAQGHPDATAYRMLSGYNAVTSTRVAASRCVDEVSTFGWLLDGYPGS